MNLERLAASPQAKARSAGQMADTVLLLTLIGGPRAGGTLTGLGHVADGWIVRLLGA